MNLSKRFLRTVALLPLVASTTAAAASPQYTTARASVSNVRIALIDLDPNDGITPYLVYRESEYSGEVESATFVKHEARGLPSHEMHDYSTTPFGASSLSMELNSPADLPAGSVAGHAALSGTSLDTIQVRASGSIDSTYDQQRNMFVYSTVSPKDFYLSPNTALSITVDLSVQSVIEGGFGNDELSLDDWVSSEAAFVFSNQWETRSFELRHTIFSNNGFPEQGKAETRTFTGQISNGAREALLTLGATSSVSAYFNAGPAPVPEPHSWAMMLGGLGLIGAMARRRSRTA